MQELWRKRSVIGSSLTDADKLPDNSLDNPIREYFPLRLENNSRFCLLHALVFPFIPLSISLLCGFLLLPLTETPVSREQLLHPPIHDLIRSHLVLCDFAEVRNVFFNVSQHSLADPEKCLFINDSFNPNSGPERIISRTYAEATLRVA